MEDDERQEESGSGGQEVAPALLALHPLSSFVVLAVGTHIRIFNLLEKCPATSKPQSGHEDAIRAISFSRDGRLFVSAGDDKLVKLWNTESWHCIKAIHANKKVSAVSFSHDGEWLMYADKFGVVYAISTKVYEDELASLNQPVQTLAHCCSIITSLRCSADGRFIVTADRDFKIRVSVFPKNPLLGAHEIEGFCLGHTSFVSSIAFVGENFTDQLFVSGGGDGTVRLWDLKRATLLDTYHVAQEVVGMGLKDALSESFAITCLSVSFDGSLIAIGIESFDGVLFLKCDLKSKRLEFLQKLVLAEHFCPTSIHFDGNGWLWLVAGAAQKAAALDQNAVTWVKVVSTSVSDTFTTKTVEVDCLPGGSLLLETLDGTDSDANKALALADTAKIAIKNQLAKRQYTPEHWRIAKKTEKRQEATKRGLKKTPKPRSDHVQNHCVAKSKVSSPLLVWSGGGAI